MGKIKMTKYKDLETTKKARTLPKRFPCFYCIVDAESVEVTLNKKKKKGYLLCGKCEKTFETPINRLSHAVDVYEAWHDFLEAEMEKKIAAIDPPIVKPPKKRRYSPY